MGPVLNGLTKLQSVENRLRAAKARLTRCRRNVVIQENRVRSLQNALEAKKEEIQLTKVQYERLELELRVLEARQHALEQQAAFVVKQHNSSMPVEEGMDEPAIVDLTIAQLNRDIAQTASQIAQKRLELFDLQG